MGPIPVDTGFIVYNTASYPNLIALFEHLSVPTAPTHMSFAVSLDQGGYEYAGSGLTSLFGQPSNILRPSHWRMIADTLRFFREARDLDLTGADCRPDTRPISCERRLLRSLHRATHPAHGGGDLVDAVTCRARLSRRCVRAVLRQPRAASESRTARNGGRWLAAAANMCMRLRAAFDGEILLGEPAVRIARSGGGVTVTTTRASVGSTPVWLRPTPTTRCACLPIRTATSGPCSAPSSMRRTVPCCIPMRR